MDPHSFSDGIPLREDGSVMLVRDVRTDRLYVRKRRTVYDPAVYRWLSSHPNPGVPAIRALEERNGVLTVLEDYVPGSSLQTLLENGARFSFAEAGNILVRLCRILEPMHAASPPIVHRDIKPSNVLLTNDGRVFLLDFNAARFSAGEKPRDTQLLGTAGYAAPEQYGFAETDARSDVYALGVLLNVLVTGGTPMETPCRNAFFPIIERCTRIDPAARYANAAELRAELERLARHPERAPGKDLYASPLPPGLRSGRPGRIALACFGYLMLAFCVWAIGSSYPTLYENALNAAAFLMIAVCMILFLGNYLHVQDKLGIRALPRGRRFFSRAGICTLILLFWMVLLYMALPNAGDGGGTPV